MVRCQNAAMTSGQTEGGVGIAERPIEDSLGQNPWVCIVWDDPVNTMMYVTHVFTTYFHYPRQKAHQLMLQVHTEGRAAVSSGTREAMETDVQAMHGYGLQASMDRQ